MYTWFGGSSRRGSCSSSPTHHPRERGADPVDAPEGPDPGRRRKPDRDPGCRRLLTGGRGLTTRTPAPTGGLQRPLARRGRRPLQCPRRVSGGAHLAQRCLANSVNPARAMVLHHTSGVLDPLPAGPSPPRVPPQRHQQPGAREIDTRLLDPITGREVGRTTELPMLGWPRGEHGILMVNHPFPRAALVARSDIERVLEAGTR